MTRKLPWLKTPSAGTPQATRSSRNVAPRAKRRRVMEPNSDIDNENRGVSRRGKALDMRGMVLSCDD